MKKYFIIFISLLSLITVSCGSDDDLKLVPNNDQQGQGEGIGPFVLGLSTDTTMKQNTFSVQIAQDEGKVEFNLPPQSVTTWMKIRFAHTSVTECDENQVEVLKFWKKDEADSGTLVNNQYFSSKPNVEGQLIVLFRNIGSCSSLSFNMIVDHVTDPYKHPKKWSFNVDAKIEGEWKNETNDFKLSVNNNYMNIESSKNAYCFKSFPYPVTDVSQIPHYLGVDSNTETLCKYEVHMAAGKEVLNLHCYNITGWQCGTAHNIQLTK